MTNSYKGNKLRKPATVSCIMAAYNCEDYIADAIKSICYQSYDDWELIIIDDASTDRTNEIATELAKKNQRIQIIRNVENKGLATSLNLALEFASGEFIARMDADDISLPDRFRLQASYLTANANCALIGTQAIQIDASGKTIGHTRLPLSDGDIRARCIFENPFVHPSIMLRRSILDDNIIGYDESFATTQDWELWVKFLAHGDALNLKTPCIMHRQHEKSISTTKKEAQRKNSLKVQQVYLRNLGASNLWDEALFRSINEVFMAERATNDIKGFDRVEICHTALNLSDQFIGTVKEKTAISIAYFVYTRSIQMGLMPPIRPGYLRLLLRLALRPLLLVKASVYVLRQKYFTS